jgi:hypothetical protein
MDNDAAYITIQTANNIVMSFLSLEGRDRCEYEQQCYEQACRFLETHYKVCRLQLERHISKEFPDEVGGPEKET